jgi:hypothetical protein
VKKRKSKIGKKRRLNERNLRELGWAHLLTMPALKTRPLNVHTERQHV